MRALPPQEEVSRPGRSLLVGLRGWIVRPLLTLSPLSALGAAAAVAVVAVVLARVGPVGPERGAAPASTVRHQFVLLAPGAESVSVVGDFNDWDATVTPLRRRGGEGVWVADVDLRGGRHVYSFVVDGEEWVPDEGVPRAPDDEFGRPSSVLLLPAERVEGQE